MENVIGNLTSEMNELNTNFKKIESELLVTKNLNGKLLERIVDNERKCWANVQYSRRECLEIVGIPNSVDDSNLEMIVYQVINKIGCNISPKSLKLLTIFVIKTEPLLSFTRRKDCQQVMKVKNGLKNLDLTDLDLPGCKVFIN